MKWSSCRSCCLAFASFIIIHTIFRRFVRLFHSVEYPRSRIGHPFFDNLSKCLSVCRAKRRVSSQHLPIHHAHGRVWRRLPRAVPTQHGSHLHSRNILLWIETGTNSYTRTTTSFLLLSFRERAHDSIPGNPNNGSHFDGRRLVVG